VILASPREVVGKTATQLGAEAGTSSTTVIRFARSIGFAGYTELAFSLAVSEPELQPADETPGDEDAPAEVLRKVSRIGARAIAELPSALDIAAFEGAVAALSGARHVLCLGASLTAPIAADLAYRLNHLGHAADAPLDSQIQRIRAKALGSDDVCVAILHGGVYPRVVAAAQDAAAGGATVIGITSFVRTPLAEVADFPLVAGANGTSAGVHAWAARLSYLALIDALVLSVHNTDPRRHDASLDAISELLQQDLL
jgi:RpiR family transcriptional regulator, carbohydrate utilization regulator